MFEFILIVVLIFIFVAQSNRMSRIESAISEMKKNGYSDAKIASSNTSQAVPVSNTPQAQVIAQNTSIPVKESAPEPILNKGGEEVSGRFLGKIGIAAVLIGVAFFLKYAFDNNWVGENGRVMIGIIIGLGFLGLGQYLRKQYLRYSDLLMGGGIAILYLSVFAARSFYGLIDPVTAGVFFFIVTALSFAISIVNATQTLALVSVIGAFATPFLVGSHENAMWSLFFYLTVINAGVLGISFFKKWPRLNVATFVGTVLNFLVWYGMYYKAADALGPTLFFCVVTFIIFLLASVARGIKAGIKADEADYILMGANAFCFAVMGYTILAPEYHGVLGFASVLVALIYMAVAFMVNKANPEDTALNIFLPGLAVTFLSAAVPLQFSGPWIAVAWFVESCILYGIASVISNRGFQVMGVVVYVLGLLDFLGWYSSLPHLQEFVPIFNNVFGVLLLATIAAYVIAYIYRKFGSINEEIMKRGIMVFVVIANVLSVFALTIQITSYYDAQLQKKSADYSLQVRNAQQYSNGYYTSQQQSDISTAYYADMSSTQNQSNTLVSILWTLYAACLTALGFVRRIASLRRLGLVLFVITALKVLVDVWSLGQLYRIISFIVFGLIALAASFGYAKYKDRLKDIV